MVNPRSDARQEPFVFGNSIVFARFSIQFSFPGIRWNKMKRERERDDRGRRAAGGRVNVLDRRRTWVTAGVEAAVERRNESKRRERSGLQASTLQAGLRVCSASEEQSDLPFSNHARCLGPSTINRQDKYTSHGGG